MNSNGIFNQRHDSIQHLNDILDNQILACSMKQRLQLTNLQEEFCHERTSGIVLLASLQAIMMFGVGWASQLTALLSQMSLLELCYFISEV